VLLVAVQAEREAGSGDVIADTAGGGDIDAVGRDVSSAGEGTAKLSLRQQQSGVCAGACSVYHYHARDEGLASKV